MNLTISEANEKQLLKMSVKWGIARSHANDDNTATHMTSCGFILIVCSTMDDK
jgi:hypothetical protein